jgi:L-threonylcarbamoyladenylate synthase
VILPFRTEADVAAALPRVRSHLEHAKVLAYPTETVYGLGSAPTVAGVDALARLKGRPEGKPFLLLVSGPEMAEQWGLVFPPPAKLLADRFWPGPLTLVLPGGEGRLPERLRGGAEGTPERGGIAVRHTSHSLIRRLIEGLGFPITSTSANRPGGPAAPGPERIASDFAEAVALGELLILDGGVLGNVPPSTLVDCTGPVLRLLREGAVTRDELRRAVGHLIS